MCGLLAWFKNDTFQNNDKFIFNSALKKQERRGPDSSNIIYGSDFALGHNRLVIIDNDSRSNQPFTKNGITFLIYNGEIYNLDYLRNILKLKKIELTTTSDTEILYELINNFGLNKTLLLIEGMFAFVFYDTYTKKLHAVKDKFGQKPLFIYDNKNDLIISSSINSIKVIKPLLKLNYDAAKNYILSLGHITPEQTFYEGISSLYAGHYLTVENETRRYERYFYPERLIGNEYLNISEEDAANEASRILSKSVKEHLNADCKVGMLLSGGIDSMLIYSFAKNYKEEITSFTKISSDIEKIPQLVQGQFLTDSEIQTIYPDKRNYLYRLFEYIKFAGRPAPWGGGPPMMDICKGAKSFDFKVLLSGDCVDEFSAGYIPSMITLESFDSDFSVPDHLCIGKYCNQDSSFNYYQEKVRKRIFSNMEKSGSEILDYFRLNSCHNIEFHLQETNLFHSDNYSMFESIELRNPYLDIQFVSFLLNLNLNKIYGNWNKKNKTGKLLLKKIAKSKYAKDCGDDYFINKEGTRNYSRYISNTKFWKLDNFLSIEILNNEILQKEILKLDDWKLIFNLINLEIFLQIYERKCNVEELFKDILSEKGKNELL